ncbi:MAG: glycosyltransferase [Candidatus Hodarchaeota archaeon]
MLESIMYAISDASNNMSYLGVIMAYPYAIPRIKRIFECIFCLLILKIFSTRCIKTFVDDFDPPVEATYAFRDQSPPFLSTVYIRFLEMLTLKLASYIIVLNEFWKQRIARVYDIDRGRILVIPNGSLISYIEYNSPKSEGPINVLYSGASVKARGVDALVQTISKLNEKGLRLNLYIGKGPMNLPQWVHVSDYPWPEFVRCVLVNSDISVIPYPPDNLFFSSIAPVKLFGYMAAGKPVISTNLKETGNLIRTFNCGLVSKDWDEFSRHIETLYHNRVLAKELGRNGRKAVEKHFNYEMLAELLLTKLFSIFKGET